MAHNRSQLTTCAEIHLFDYQRALTLELQNLPSHNVGQMGKYYVIDIHALNLPGA